MIAPLVRYLLVASLALLLLVAFVSYLRPEMTGEVAEALLRCN